MEERGYPSYHPGMMVALLLYGYSRGVYSSLGLPRFGGHRERFRVRCLPMPGTRPPYPTEFRRQMVGLVRAGRDPHDLAREFGPSAQAIRNWVAAADRSEGRREASHRLLIWA